MKRLFHLFFWFGLVSLSGCSLIQKNSYWKSRDQDTNWTFVNGKMWSPYYSYRSWDEIEPSVPYYVRCDSSTLFTLALLPVRKCILTGPPFLPIVPGHGVVFEDWAKPFTFEVILKTTADVDSSMLAHYVHFFINDATQEMLPSFEPGDSTGVITWRSKPWKKKPVKAPCLTPTNLLHYVRLVGKLNINAAAVKTIRVQFDEKLKRLLNDDIHELHLRKKSRPHYFALEVPTH